MIINYFKNIILQNQKIIAFCKPNKNKQNYD